MGDWIAIQDHGDVWAWAARGHVWVHGPDVALACVDVLGS